MHLSQSDAGFVLSGGPFEVSRLFEDLAPGVPRIN